MQIAPVTGTIGAEVTGLDVSQPISVDAAEALRDALDRYLVIFLPDQEVDHERQKAVTEVFGPLCKLPYVEPLPGDEYVIAVLKEADEVNAGVFGGDWHSDFSFLERPPAGSLLHAKELPPYGGDTLWANQVRAYEMLPVDLRQLVDGRRAVHLGAPYGLKHAPPKETRSGRSIRIARGDPSADEERFHPAVCTHPRSGRKALFLNPIYTTRFEDMTVEESKPHLARLYAHMTRPELACRHRWSTGDLVVWDNRTTLHYAVNDYDGYRRLLTRTTFAGERPV